MGTIKVLEPDRQIQESFIWQPTPGVVVLGSSGYLSLLLATLDTKSGLIQHVYCMYCMYIQHVYIFSRGGGVFLVISGIFYCGCVQHPMLWS